jgi:hypothetical protein
VNIGQILFSETVSTCLGCERWKATYVAKDFMKPIERRKQVLNLNVYILFKEHIIIIIMVLQPFGPWPLFQVLDPIHSRYDSLGGGSARLKASTYTQSNTNTE